LDRLRRGRRDAPHRQQGEGGAAARAARVAVAGRQPDLLRLHQRADRLLQPEISPVFGKRPASPISFPR
jgi:hypothetical protein